MDIVHVCAVAVTLELVQKHTESVTCRGRLFQFFLVHMISLNNFFEISY